MKNLTTQIQRGIAFALMIAMALMLVACGAPDTTDIVDDSTIDETVEEWAELTVMYERANADGIPEPFDSLRRYSAKVGESFQITNPTFEGLVTAWPIIDLGVVTGDRLFTVRYYGEDEISPERLAEMAGERTVMVNYDYQNGARHAAPSQVQKLAVGSTFVFKTPSIYNYTADVEEIADIVRTDCPPEGVKSYTVTYGFAGDPADEPFQVTVDYVFETYEPRSIRYNHATDFYWYKEGEEINIELPKFVGFRAKEACLTGEMERENQHFLAEYVEDASQTEGEELHLTLADFAIAMSEAAFGEKMGLTEESED